MRERRLAAVLVAGALLVAAGMVGWSSVAAALAHEENVRLRLSEAPIDERAVQVVYHLVPNDADTLRDDVTDFFSRLDGVTERPRALRLWHGVGNGEVRVVVVEEPRRDVHVAAGRLPTGCQGGVCEALALTGDLGLGDHVRLDARTSLRIVGRGSLSHAVLPVESEALPATPELTNRAVLVTGVASGLATLTRHTGSSVVTTAPLEPTAVPAASLRALSERLRVGFVELKRTGGFVETAAPFALLDALADRGDVARERLLLIAGQGAALVVAFAAFAAAVRRRDRELLSDQLRTLGASRAQTALARLPEAALPVLAGAAVALVALAVAVRVIAARRDLPPSFIEAALPAETIAVIAALAAASVGLLVVAGAPARRSRWGIGALELAAVTALAMLLWQATTVGALDPEGIAAGERGGPVLLLLPALAFLASGVLLLRILPFLLKLAERLARKAGFGTRLAFLSAARAPAEAAAATTFLAVAVGSALFGLNYRATLERQAHDEANFAAGAAWRVIERAGGDERRANLRPDVELSLNDRQPATVAEQERLNHDLNVTPLTRFRAASDERPTPVLRLEAQLEEASVAGDDGDVEVVALPAGRVDDLRGWREGFSALERHEIATRLRPRPVRLTGPKLADDATAVRVWARSKAKLKRYVILHFLLPAEQRFVHVRGGILSAKWRRVPVRLRRSLRGAELVALEFPPVSIPQGAPPDEGSIQLGATEQRRNGRWSPLRTSRGWAASAFSGPVDSFELVAGPVRRVTQLSLAGAPVALVHTDVGLPDSLPAVASEAVAAAAVDDRLTVYVGGTALSLRVVGSSRFFPSVLDDPETFVVLDYDTVFAALNASRPAVALPSEAWFFTPQRSDFLAQLGEPPFRVERVVAADALTARLRTDPLAAGARDVLLYSAAAAALLGLAGLLLAARSTLAAERGIFAEYETLGVRPATLERSTQIRLVFLAALGLAAGFLGGLVGVRLIGALVAVSGSGERPLPPIEPGVAWRADSLVVVVMTIAALIGAALVARSALRESIARRLRA